MAGKAPMKGGWPPARIGGPPLPGGGGGMHGTVWHRHLLGLRRQ
jgi:hypothetical protein